MSDNKQYVSHVCFYKPEKLITCDPVCILNATSVFDGIHLRQWVLLIVSKLVSKV